MPSANSNRVRSAKDLKPKIWRLFRNIPLFSPLLNKLYGPQPSLPDRIEKGKTYTFWHTAADYRHFNHTVEGTVEPLLKPRLEQGQLLGKLPSLIRENPCPEQSEWVRNPQTNF